MGSTASMPGWRVLPRQTVLRPWSASPWILWPLWSASKVPAARVAKSAKLGVDCVDPLGPSVGAAYLEPPAAAAMLWPLRAHTFLCAQYCPDGPSSRYSVSPGCCRGARGNTQVQRNGAAVQFEQGGLDLLLQVRPRQLEQQCSNAAFCLHPCCNFFTCLQLYWLWHTPLASADDPWFAPADILMGCT